MKTKSTNSANAKELERIKANSKNKANHSWGHSEPPVHKITPELERIINPQKFVPKCPTCQSTNVQKISVGSKAVGGFFFGLFSSDVRNTMKCNNCGYKW